MVGQSTYHVNVIKLKREIIWTGGLPHLPGVPHLHVNRPSILLGLHDRWGDPLQDTSLI